MLRQYWRALRDGVGRNRCCSSRFELRRSLAIGPHESKRARFYEGNKGDADDNGSPSVSEVHGVHVFQCRDQLGIIARISKCIASRGANILNVDLYIDFDGGKQSPVFYARSEFAFDPLKWPRAVMDEDFAELSHHFQAERSVVRVLGSDSELKLAVLASWQDHCLIDLLHRWQEGVLPVNLTCVISNHSRGPNTHVLRFLERHGIPYHYLPTSRGNKREEDILELIADTDFLVLARYMQVFATATSHPPLENLAALNFAKREVLYSSVLSPSFLRGYKKDIINIHHGLLPSFKGANPYRQAYETGVKLIGATSHFVTAELDDGPIIEQMVDRVSHRDSLNAFATRSENLEKQCLGNAIKYYCEQRILRYSNNKTIIFG